MENIVQKIGNQRLASLVLILLACASVQAQTFPPTGFTLPAGKTICITYEVTVNANACPTGTLPSANLSNQSNVSGSNFATVQTDDPDIVGSPGPTLTPFSTLTLGNLVYRDNNRNGVFDGGDVGIDGVTLRVYLDNGDGVLTVADGAFIGNATTAGGGLYSFAVCPGNYIVEVAPSNFTIGGALYNSGAPLLSSPVGGATDPDDDVNNDDNGDPVAGFGVASAAVTVAYGAEPAIGVDGDDANGNLTVDFGFKTPATVTVAVAPSSVLEDGGVGLVYTFTRNDANPSPIVVNFSVGGTATFSTDYTQSGATIFNASSGTVTFTGSNTMATVTLTPTSDLTVEPDETAILTITSGTDYAAGAPGAATGTITNDDTDVTVAVAPGNVAEDGVPNLVYTFTRTGVTSGALTVNFTVGGTATFSTDYTQTGAASFTATTGTVTFIAGSSTATVTVDPTADATVEPNETVNIVVAAGTGYNVGLPSLATSTILNEDTDVTVAVAPSSVLEDGATNLVYIFTRTGVTIGTLTVNFSVGGTATFSTDYTQTGAASFSASSGTVTFTGSNTMATVTIDPTADIALEPDETVVLTITSGVSYNVATPSIATGTITNDDNSVSVAVSPASVLENSGTDLVYTFTRTDVNSGALVVNFSVGGTAGLGTDYTQAGATSYTATTGTVTFSGVSPTATFTLTPTPDNVVEPDETAIITVTSGTGYGIGAPGVATGTITNDDAATLTLSGGITQDETNAGTVSYVFTATLSADVQGGFQVPYTTNDGTATTADNDYTDNDGTFTFTGIAGEIKTFTVLVNGDTKVELDETFTTALGAITGAPAGVTTAGSPQTATITNDESATVSIAANVSQSESTTPQVFSVTLSNPVDVAVTVVFSTSDGTAATGDNDYTGIAGQTVTFAAGTTTAQSVNVTITNDSKVEADEVYNTSIGTLAAGGRNVSLGTTTRTGTITNDDSAILAITAVTAQSEGNSGINPYVFTVTLNVPVQGGFSLAYTTNDGTATTADNDYVDNDGPALVFTGTANEMKTINVLINGDSRVEADETFSVVLGAISGTTLGASINIAGSPKLATIVNDEVDWGDGPDSLPTVLASNGARHNAVLGFQLGATIDGDPDGQPGLLANGDDTDADGDDEDGVTLPGVFVTGTTATITVNASQVGRLDAFMDFDWDRELYDAGEKIFDNVALVAGNNVLTFNVPLTAVVGSSFLRFRFSSMGGLSNAGPASDGEVEDYRTNIVSNQFSVDNPSVTEGNAGTATLTFTVSRTTNTTASSVDYATSAGTATLGVDYVANASGTINFTMGGPLSQTVSLTVNSDLIVENNETILLTLSNPMNGGLGVTPGTGTITNDDTATLTLSGGTSNPEGTGFTFNATLNNSVQGGFTVAYNTNNGTATVANNDYTDNDATLTFAGTTGEIHSFTVSSTVDNIVELDETFTTTLGAITGTSAVQIAAISTAGSPQTGTILNDDGAVVALAGNISQSEAITPQTFTVTLSSPVDVNVTVQFSTTNTTATTGDNDYVGIVSQTVTFLAGTTTSQSVPVTINNDNKVEGDEIYNINIGTLNASGRNVELGTSAVAGTILNDDNATVTLTGTTSVPEGNSGQSPVVFTATLNNPVQAGFTVFFSTNDGTATTANNDYVDNDGAFAFAGTAGEIQTITVQVNGDLNIEPNETFTVAINSLSFPSIVNPASVTVVGSPQTGTINNDELDWGDAPTSAQSGLPGLYPTLLANGGAAHTLTVNGLRLGAAVDADLDGQPTATANGDGADDDGVTLPSALVINTTANITVISSGAGNLQGWVDFNIDGDWNDAGEQIFTDQAVVAGNNALSFAVPPGATLGTSFARFRLSTAVGLGLTGTTANGEVEDYAIEIVNTQFNINDVSVMEGNAGTTNLTFTISRTVNANASSVNYSITGGTATSGSDYQPFAGGTINFTAGGALSQTVTVVVTGDLTVELDETVIMTLASPVGGSILDGTGIGTIQNDDAAVITITSPTIVEGDAGSTNLVFTINMSNPSDANVVVNYTTVDGTAIQPGDYTLTAGSHTFTPGQISKTVSVPIIGDCSIEPNETFLVRLSGLVNNGRNVTLSGGGATLDGTGTITNDDALPVITCPGNITMNAAAGVCNATVTVTLPTTGSLCGASILEFRYRTVNAMNAPTGPYTALISSASNSVNFAVGRYEVEWQVTDGSGTSTCTFFLEVVDNQPPVANCFPVFTLNLNGAGTGTLTVANLNNNSTDNCGITTSSVTPINFTCANVGPVTATLTVGDAAGLTASCTSQVNVIASAICTPPAIGNSGGPNISDPCTCLGNGRFSEEVVIGPSNPGQLWTVQSTTLINPNTNAPYAPGTLFTEVNIGGGQSIYVLAGVHLDGVGYTLTATSLYFPNVVLSISNTCFYPDPVITGPEGVFCLNSADATFSGTAGPGIDGTGQFFLNGVPVPTVETPVNSNNWVTTLDFSVLGLGSYTLVFQFDAGNPAGLLDPPNVGCIASVSRIIHVVATPSNLVCNDLLTISLDETCSLVLNADDILEGTYLCYDDYKVELDRTLPLGNGPWVAGILGPNDVHHTYAVKVTHLVSGNNCWGNIAIEDKLPPVITCPCSALTDNTCTYTCADKDGILNGLIATPLPVAVDGCEGPITTVVTNPNAPGANLYKKDVYFAGADACSPARIERTWTAKDSWGNSAQCTQIFYLEPFNLDDVDFPEDITINCAGCGITANTLPCETGVPTVEGFDADGVYQIIQYNANCQVISEGLCNLGAQYEDTKIIVCAGTFKILRHWTVLDWCTNTVLEGDQLIKVVDNVGPVITPIPDMTVSTNPSQCCATVNLPNTIIEDACSGTSVISAMVTVYDQYLPGQVVATYNLSNLNQFFLSNFPGNNFWDCDTLGNFGNTPCLPIGTHEVMYIAEDVCGNTSTESFLLTVVDDVAPVATCTQFTTVAIGVDDPTDCYEPTGACEFAGVTWVPASAFNQGSYDNCNGVFFTIRRMPEADDTYSDCIDDLKPLCNQYEYNIATTENDSIKFYCCEVGTTQTVIFRAYQIDLYGHIMLDADENPIYNECMIQVEVQDKIKPVCQPPANVTVSCENFEPTLWAYGYPTISDNCCLDETPPTSANPGGVSGIPAGTTAIPGVCGLTQKTYYNYNASTYFDTTCNRGTIVRRFTAWDCYGFSSSCTQRVVVEYHQDYNIRFPADVSVNCVQTPDFGRPIITNDEGCELIGISYNDVVFTIVPDACYKIERTWTVINWCTYDPDLPCYAVPRSPVNPLTGLAPFRDWRVWEGIWEGALRADENCVTYKQIIKVKDLTPPTIACQDIDTCDVSTNNVRYWNDGLNWWDNGTMQHDLCESSTDISVTAEDFCDSISPVGGLRFRYLLFLDLDGDGIMETVVSSADAATTPPGRVLYNNYQSPNYHGGTPWVFDNTTSSSQRYSFSIEQTANGASVVWRNSGGFIAPELAHGRHKIKWIAEDGCGNEAVCEKTFQIRDCKPPVVACASVNINLMVGGMATLWANDFFLYGDDNCTPDAILEAKLAIIRADANTGNEFPTDLPQSIDVFCEDFATGQPVPVQVWLIDAAGNADFCIAYVDPQPNLVGCVLETPMATVAGALATEEQQGVEDASVELVAVTGVMADQSDVTGSFLFPAAVPQASDYTLTPTKDDNPMNGVTTYDLVLISKHILGLEPLTTPYKMIAADANRSGSITTFDIVEFRKLILGIYEELPQNTSWRFVDKSYSFPNPANPFQSTFPENISVQNVQTNHLTEDFVGVKVGDVNGTVTPNSLVSVDDRTSATMLFDVEDRAVKAGEVFTLNFKGAQRVQGYQFTMNFNGLEVVDIAPGTDMKLDNFGVFADAITTSVDGASNEFAVTFRATKAGQISTMLSVSSRITKAEGYSLTNDRLDIAFRFNGANGSVISGVGFELYKTSPTRL